MKKFPVKDEVPGRAKYFERLLKLKISETVFSILFDSQIR